MDRVLLIYLINFSRLLSSTTIYVLHNWVEFGSTKKLDFMKRCIVRLQNCLISRTTLWIKNISVKRKTVGNLLTVRNFTTEAIDRKHFVIIIIFKDSKDTLNYVYVVISLCIWMNIMQGILVCNSSVGQCVVNWNMDSNLTTSKDVVKEGYFIL